MSIKSALAELGKDSPVVGLAGASWAGININSVILYLGLAYAVARLAVLAFEGYMKWTEWRERRNGKGK